MSVTPRQNTTTPADSPRSEPGGSPEPPGESARGGTFQNTTWRQLTPPTVDGGTALRAPAWEPRFSSQALRGLLGHLDGQRDEKGADLDPFLMLRGQDGRRRRVRVRAWTSGPRGATVQILCGGLFHLRCDRDRKRATVQLKAAGLWALGFAAAAAWVCSALHEELFGAPLSAPTLDAVELAGWRVVALELCCDVTGIDLANSDLPNFVGRAKKGSVDPLKVDSWGRGDALETVNIGRRSSPVSLCWYSKTEQIAQAKEGDASTYAATWRAAGWDGREPVRRLELRGNGHGLTIAQGARILSLALPSAVASAEALAIWWRVQTQKRRLVIPRDASRKERCATDPRWLALESCAEPPPGFNPAGWRQARQVQREAALTMHARASRAGLRALARVAAIHGRLPCSKAQEDMEPAQIREALVAALCDATLAALSDLGQDRAQELAAYAAAYRERWDVFLGPELSAVAEEAQANHPPTKTAAAISGALPERAILGGRFLARWDAGEV